VKNFNEKINFPNDETEHFSECYHCGPWFLIALYKGSISQHGKGIAALKRGKAAGRGKNQAHTRNSNGLNGALGSRTAHKSITDFVLLKTPPYSQGGFSSP